jgi:hypothetical protein
MKKPDIGDACNSVVGENNDKSGHW